MGAEIHRYTTVTGVTRAGDKWVVHTDKGDITASTLSAARVISRARPERCSASTSPSSRSSTNTSSPSRIQPFRRGRRPAAGNGRAARGRFELVYARENGGFLLVLTSMARPPATWTLPIRTANMSCSRKISTASPRISRPPWSACRPLRVGIKKVYNGAIAYTPDGSPIVGPAWDVPNVWLNEGHSFGVTAAGGAGWQLAEWIVDGNPTVDMLGVDPRRFGPYAGRGYLKTKNEEAYANVITPHYPDEERVAARPLKTAPCYDRMKALGRCSAPFMAGSARAGSRRRTTHCPERTLAERCADQSQPRSAA